MNILYYNCFAGISGDMNLSALIDLGVDFDTLKNELTKLNLAGYHLELSRDSRNGIFGSKIDVILEDPHSHPHRTMKDIKAIIESSSLNQSVSAQALDIFQIIAEAEAKVHGTTPDKVHFHEVGAVDSIVDIVGAAICLDLLNVDKIVAGTIELGSGFVKCAHGSIPVPAPATVAILQDVPTACGNTEHEATTPTGAAILKACVDQFSDKNNFTVNKIGYGIGHRQTEKPNVLRVMLAEDNQAGNALSNQNMLGIECSIDDMNPEFYDYILEKLFAAGVADAFITPIIMKKNRPAHNLTIVCSPELDAEVSDIVLTETTTLGIRKYPLERQILQRDVIEVETNYGLIRVKHCFHQGKLLRAKAEYEDCKAAAIKFDVPLADIYNEVNKLCQ